MTTHTQIQIQPEKVIKKSYSLGDCFIDREGVIYMLCQVDPCKVLAIVISAPTTRQFPSGTIGNRNTGAITVTQDKNFNLVITESDLEAILAGSYRSAEYITSLTVQAKI